MARACARAPTEYKFCLYILLIPKNSSFWQNSIFSKCYHQMQGRVLVRQGNRCGGLKQCIWDYFGSTPFGECIRAHPYRISILLLYIAYTQKQLIFGYKQYIATKVRLCGGARVCARQMVLIQSSPIYIVSIPHIDCPSAREPYLAFDGKILKKSNFAKVSYFWV